MAAITGGLLQQICDERRRRKRITTDAEAWQWIADELSKTFEGSDSAIPRDRRIGLCSTLGWMCNVHIISQTRKRRMVSRLYNYFCPEYDRGEYGDDPYFWIMGVREPRVIAAQLMAIMPTPGRRRT